LLASGALDGYTRQASFRRPDGEVVTFGLQVSACTDPQPRQYAVATILTPDRAADFSCAVDSAGVEDLMIGTVDGQWRVDRVTSADDPALAYTSQQILGGSAFIGVHPEDVGALLLLAAHATASAGGAFGRVRLAARDGGWVTRRIGLQQLIGEKANGFAFAVWRETNRPQRGDPSRGAMDDLHAALETTDAHPKAAGLAAWMAAFPTGLQVPELSTLTSREYEIVLRLASGDRVRTIAGALHLSQSTVRNHLTSVFRKFNVHSQGELLARLRPASAAAAVAPAP
jgi:DNA-binding CsgD family transcriptional regulator